MLRLHTLGALELRRPDGPAWERLLPQPKRLALLAYLAVVPGAFYPRDLLLALFWPELDAQQGRRALRQALHYLRRYLASDAIMAQPDGSVGLAPGAVWCDAAALVEAARAGEPALVLSLYTGDFLVGSHAEDTAPELEEWVARLRGELRAHAVRAAWEVSAADQREGRHLEAALAAHRAVELAPDDEAGVRRLMALLDGAGDRAGALRVHEQLAARTAHEFGAEPAPETQALAAAIRARTSKPQPPVLATPDADAARPLDESVILPAVPLEPLPGRREGPRWRPIAAGAVLTAGALLGTLGPLRRSAPSEDVAFAAAATPFDRPRLTDAERSHRLVETGLRLQARGDVRSADSLYWLAIDADSSNVLASLHLAECRLLTDPPAGVALLDRTLRVARYAAPRERALVELRWRALTNTPSRLATAESLAALAPDDGDVRLGLAQALAWDGQFMSAIHMLRELLARRPDRPARTSAEGCVRCAASAALVEALTLADSLPAAEAVARAWLAFAPGSRDALSSLREALAGEGKLSAATAAQVQLANLDVEPGDGRERAVLAIRAGDFARADRLLHARAEEGSVALRADALGLLVLSLRNQGRLHEALGVARQLRWVGGRQPSDEERLLARVPEAMVLGALGAYEAAAAIYDSVLRTPPLLAALIPGQRARHAAWYKLHLAEAAAAQGDTMRLAALIDTVAILGRRSAYGRDRVLHAHLRGLLALARHEPDQAVAFLRSATFSPVGGYTVTNLELGRVLLALRRPREAVAALAPALRGGVEGSNLYATHAELHEALAQAYDAAGESDSAAAHYGWLVTAWAAADEPLRARWRQASARLETLGYSSSDLEAGRTRARTRAQPRAHSPPGVARSQPPSTASM